MRFGGAWLQRKGLVCLQSTVFPRLEDYVPQQCEDKMSFNNVNKERGLAGRWGTGCGVLFVEGKL